MEVSGRTRIGRGTSGGYQSEKQLAKAEDFDPVFAKLISFDFVL